MIRYLSAKIAFLDTWSERNNTNQPQKKRVREKERGSVQKALGVNLLAVEATSELPSEQT